jgi:hypothetical protein
MHLTRYDVICYDIKDDIDFSLPVAELPNYPDTHRDAVSIISYDQVEPIINLLEHRHIDRVHDFLPDKTYTADRWKDARYDYADALKDCEYEEQAGLAWYNLWEAIADFFDDADTVLAYYHDEDIDREKHTYLRRYSDWNPSLYLEPYSQDVPAEFADLESNLHGTLKPGHRCVLSKRIIELDLVLWLAFYPKHADTN